MAKFRTILEVLRKEIVEGKYDHKHRLPTESQLVARFSVSRPTVARALRELQTEGIVQRKAGSGSYLRRGALRDTGKLGLIVPSLGMTEIFDPICAEIARLANEGDYVLLSSGSWPSDLTARARQAEELCHRFIREKVSGVFFAPVEQQAEDETTNLRIIAPLVEAGIPVVLLDRDAYKFPRRSTFDLVGIDNFAAGFELARHLIDLGCTRISFIARPRSAATVDMRIAGWREAMVRARLPCGPEQIYFDEVSDDLVKEVLAHAKTEAIICANDMTAAVVMQSLMRLGIRVPEDVRLAGFDDLKYAALLSVPLTTMHQPCQELGQAAIEAMRERIRNPGMSRRQILLTASLVVRQTCGAQLPAAGGKSRRPAGGAQRAPATHPALAATGR